MACSCSTGGREGFETQEFEMYPELFPELQGEARRPAPARGIAPRPGRGRPGPGAAAGAAPAPGQAAGTAPCTRVLMRGECLDDFDFNLATLKAAHIQQLRNL